ncbi:hypothetical protein RSOL_251580 [Rhizoctonia solani AG-3 Rhs1AP]|uniref:Uncharacterized protein n=1 Tax=Rhizoctonia solani AG-3 Rhs1AP TaxID=1086054 RepID=A0A0A1UHQ5_9AGAM|nr:hypothetical protein RSOL_251580 [Rhizoctonia solani AG-3 Rhs1AP]
MQTSKTTRASLSDQAWTSTGTLGMSTETWPLTVATFRALRPTFVSTCPVSQTGCSWWQVLGRKMARLACLLLT